PTSMHHISAKRKKKFTAAVKKGGPLTAGRRECGGEDRPLLLDVGGGGRLLTHGQGDGVDHKEGHHADGAAEHHRQNAEEEAAAAEELPDQDARRAGPQGEWAGGGGGPGHRQSEAVGGEGPGAADAEGEGVHGDDVHAEHGDAHGDQGEDHVADPGVEDDGFLRQIPLAAQAHVQVVHHHGGHAQQVGVGGGHGGADDGGGDQPHDDPGGMGAGDGHHGVAAVGGQAGDGVLDGQGGQTQQGGEDGHGRHEDGGEPGGVLRGALVLGGLEPGDHLGPRQEGAEVVEDVADDGDPANLGEVQLHRGQGGGDGLPATAALNDDGGGDGQAHQNDDELDQVGDLVGDHAAEGGVEDDHQAGDDQGHGGGDARRGGQHCGGGGELAGGQ